MDTKYLKARDFVVSAREALRRGDIQSASRKAQVFVLTPVAL